jgi:uncharacterized phage protein gp47/JayE
MSLTAEGFERQTLPEIKTDLDADFTDALGPVNTEPDSVTGQIIGIVAEAVDTIQSLLQDTYDAMYPYSAEGTSLDGAVALVGLSRIEASPTIVTAAAYDDEGAVVPANQLVVVNSTEFLSTSDVVVSRANALDVEIQVNTVTNSASYQILAAGESVTYTSDSSATAAEIIAGLAALLDTDTFVVSATNDTLRFYSADGVSPFAVTADAKLTITRRGSPVVFVAQENGAIAVPVGAVTSTDSGIELYNLAAGDIGRDVESDVDLRARHATSVRGTGSATVEAIKARMLADVDGVTSVAIYENRTAAAVDGIPAHAFETVVEGGTNSAIAAQLWLTKPAGIETHGNVTVLTPDTAGDNQTVKFSRAETVYGWLSIDVTALYTEEPLPASAVNGIKEAAVAYANANIGVGEDVILQRFYGPIFDAVSGIASMDIEADVTALPGDTPSYSAANISVARTEIAVFDVARVTVTGI